MKVDDAAVDFPRYSFVLSLEGSLRNAGPSWCNLTGYSVAEARGRRWYEYLSSEEQRALQTRWQRWLNALEPDFEADGTFRLADGSQLPVHVTLQRSADEIRGYLTPQLKVRQLGKHMQMLEARLDALFRTGNQTIVILDLNHRILDFNQTAAQTSWLRFHREMARGEHFVNYVQPDRLEDFYESFQQVLQGRHVFKERVIYAADRQGYSYEMTYTPIYDDKGRIDSVCFMMLNIEQQRQTRLLLNQEQSFVTSILNATNSLIIVVDKQGQMVRFNKACESLTGYSLDEVRDSVFWELLVMPEDRERVRQLYQQIDERSELSNVQFRLRDRLGGSHFISWSLSVMQGLKEDTQYIVSTGIDVTDRLAAEQALQESEAMLRQAQKMEAVGHLAGGIAHDFNNLLTGIIGYGQLLEHQAALDSDGRDYLNEILRTADKAKALTGQLLMFSRKAPADSHPVQIAQVLCQLEGLLRQLLDSQIQLILAPEANPGWIQGNVMHLEQVILNLVVNARDAMDGRGVLTISTRRQYFAEDVHLPMFGSFAAGDYVCLSVADTGCGMSEDVRLNIFEPFFTTKERGRGTGLGLAVVYRIVREFGGWVEVSSIPGQGSTFELFFAQMPALPELAADRCQMVLYKLPVAQSQAIRNSLQDFGCGIASVEQPDQLLNLCDQEKPPRLLITHLHQSTAQGYSMLMHRCPELRILYLASSSPEEMNLLDSLGKQEDVLLEPFTMQELRVRIRRMLDGEQR